METAEGDSGHSAAWPVGGARGGPGGRGRALASWRGSMGPPDRRLDQDGGSGDGFCISCDVDGQRVSDHRKRGKHPSTTRDHRLGSKPPGGGGQLAGPAARGPGPQSLPVGGTRGGAPWLGARGRGRRTRQLAGHGGGPPGRGRDSRARWEGAGLGQVAGGRGSDGWGGVDRNIYAGTYPCTHLHIYIHLPPCLHPHIYLSTTHRWTTPRPPATPVGSPAPAPQR